MHKGYFITGTDTGIGKTHVSCALLTAFGHRGLRTAAMKPVASGSLLTDEGWRNDDALRLQQAANISLDYDAINPYALPAPVSPHLAAREAGLEIDIDGLKLQYDTLSRQADITIVEGVGGWQVPLNASQSTTDLARRLALPIIVVVGIRLGCINHGLLTFESITRTAGNPAVAGWIANIIEPETLRIADIIATLVEAIEAPCLGTLPFLENIKARSAEQQAGLLDVDVLL